jgi:hypothetical protein
MLPLSRRHFISLGTAAVAARRSAFGSVGDQQPRARTLPAPHKLKSPALY